MSGWAGLWLGLALFLAAGLVAASLKDAVTELVLESGRWRALLRDRWRWRGDWTKTD